MTKKKVIVFYCASCSHVFRDTKEPYCCPKCKAEEVCIDGTNN